MAWTDSCKFEACKQIDHRQDECGGVRPAIKKLSEESGIPQGTLNRWYYNDKCTKNGAPKKPLSEETIRAKKWRAMPKKIEKLILSISGLDDGLPLTDNKSQKYYDEIISRFGKLRNCMDRLEEKIGENTEGGKV
jgi:hypothetical protein